VANASGEAWYRGELDFTGGEMVLVLKLISVAVCLQDFHDKKPEVGR
jgi:lysophospholipid acyltransferase